jgi:hypothetical protein
MEVEPIGLTVQFVPAELEPAETFVDRIERGRRVPFDVGIIDAENHYTALVARIEPIEDERASAAYVKVAGGRGRKSDTCHI